MKTTRYVYLLLGVFSINLLHAQETQLSAEQEVQQLAKQQEYDTWASNLWASMERQTGSIQLPNNVAELTVPEDFYYLNSVDSQKVLEEIWGNPPGSAESLLGMLFPAGSSPFEGDAWGVTIEYEQDGYVMDEDADKINYSELLEQMKEDTALSSEQRVEQGYPPITLVGWAAPPFYEKNSNKLYWAKEIQFGEAENNTLNYNIRVLGRKGVLVLNFIAGMDQLSIINQNLDRVLAIAEFNQGSRYADFDPDIDDVAAYGIGALVAGKVLAKTGLIAAAIIFFKKFGIIFILAAGAFIKKFLGRKKDKVK